MERLKLEQELRAKAEAAAAEAERARTVMAADYKDVTQKFERIKEELKALQEKVLIVSLLPCLFLLFILFSSHSFLSF